jgi:hypothetical protein
MGVGANIGWVGEGVVLALASAKPTFALTIGALSFRSTDLPYPSDEYRRFGGRAVG